MRRNLHPPQPILIQQEHLPVSTKAEVSNTAIHQDLRQQHAARRPDADPIPTPAVHVIVHVALDSVRDPDIRHGEKPPVEKERLARVRPDIERVSSLVSTPVSPDKATPSNSHMRRPRAIRAPVPVDPVRVRDVARLLIRAETDAIRPAEPVCNSPDTPRRRIEAVDLVGQLRARADALLGPVYGVCEPDAAVRVDDDVVGGVERPGVEGCDEQRGGVCC